MIRPSTLFAACCLMLCDATAAPPPIALYTLEWAPYIHYDATRDRTEGIISDIVEEAMKRTGRTYASPVIVPWARGLAKTAVTPDTCLFPAARVPERETLYQWIGPISKNHWALFARTADHLRVKGIEDLKGYEVGMLLGDFNVGYFSSHGVRVAVVPDDRLNPRKLQMKRIDVWAAELLVGQRMLREQGITDVEPVFSFVDVDQYLACNHSMPKDEVARLNDIIKTMWTDGSIARIYARYSAEPGLPRRLAAPN